MSPIKTTPRVFLVGNARKPHVAETFARLARWLEERGLLVGSDLNGHPERIHAARANFVITLGGDGTILSAGQAMQHDQVPIIGVNVGKLGYLADFSADELEAHLDQITADPQFTSRRMMLDVLIIPPSGETWRGVALNDCVLRVGEPFRTIGLSMTIDEQPVTTIVGDGLIISTPTGSTAHNMSGGGPIVQPEVDAIILTPKCPHSLTHRPVVVGPEARICISALESNEGTHVVLDGQSVHAIAGGTRVQVHKSKEAFQLVRNPKRRSWDTLVQKLKWGQALT